MMYIPLDNNNTFLSLCMMYILLDNNNNHNVNNNNNSPIVISLTPTLIGEVVGDFWKKWYHPERIAVCIVGDFDDGGASAIKLIENAWSTTMKRAEPPPPKPIPGLPEHKGVKVTITVDAEATSFIQQSQL